MIKTNDKVFILETKNLSYIFHVDDTGLLIHDYFGNHIDLIDFDVTPIKVKNNCAKGTSVIYKKDINKELSMDNAYLEFSFPHKGDYKITPISLRSNKYGYVFDFNYDSYEIKEHITPIEGLPVPHEDNGELIIRIKDQVANIIIELHYFVYEDSDVIGRYTKLINEDDEELTINKLLSLQLDLPNRDYQLLTLSGAWASEMHKQLQDIKPGVYVNESRTGFSSHRHNPFIMIKQKYADLFNGDVYSFNLLYSGNHLEEVELSSYDQLRVELGINSFCFNWIVKPGESFTTPVAVMSYSSKGINGARNNMHYFINNHIVPKTWANKDRPIVINNWEGTYFKFSESKLLKLAKDAKDFGVEVFVLDDGWFSNRNDDSHGLGDYDVNKKKLRHGLDGLANKINKLGMKFGLWFEPESVNKESKLFKAHPDWIIANKDHTPSEGRNQYLLDLSKKEVQDYIISNVSNVLKSANIEFVKWDMNRHMSDIYSSNFDHGEFYHRYILGLYKVMDTLVKEFPHILFEGCASGGNRFDLGILSYFPQIWASDDTDAFERIQIQSGYYLGYPLSTISAHVSSSPSHQLLREIDIDTRFNVAMFGVLGFELLFNETYKLEQNRIKKYVDYYKQNRHTFQYGEFKEISDKDISLIKWQISDKNTAFVAHFMEISKLNNGETRLNASGLDPQTIYDIKVLYNEHNIHDFGGLVNTMLPVHLNPNGFIVNFVAKKKAIPGENESYRAYGNVLMNKGLLLNPLWSATGMNEGVRIMKDFSSRLYMITPSSENKE